ncbi:MAG: transcriptional repressor LexA [Hyphomonadaceae bacterium]|nr:transcriptional repressor LexA [Hyphomonadaceae bacterium]
MLTQKQHDLLKFIDKRLKKNSVSPSYDEMKDALGLASKSGIHRLITALEERGFIRRLPHRARALEVLKLPGDTKATPEVPVAANDSVSIPLVGKIAAGVPIAALEQDGPRFSVPDGMIGRGDHYALEIEGESMIGAGILDGDIAVIKKSNTARNNQIVVAYVVDDEEATLKRLYKSANGVELIAENPDFPTRTFGPDRVEVQGVLVGIVRKYN